MSAGEGEFAFIKRRLKPLAGEGALDLADDAAVITPPSGAQIVLAADALVAGRHFPADEEPGVAARKALRANLSDLAAMGARPIGYLTSVVWPEDADDAMRAAFADGLAADQARYACPLLGGDTTSGPGAWTIAITAVGAVPSGRAVTRAGANAGDRIYVTGTIGDAGLGLTVLEGRYAPPLEERMALLERYRLPEPRLACADALHGHASAAIDVSDGLIADARHIAEASRLALTLDLDRLPLSEAARAWLRQQKDEAGARLSLASFGDDYELITAVPAREALAFEAAGAACGAPATWIGEASEGAPRLAVRAGGREIDAGVGGFTHF